MKIVVAQPFEGTCAVQCVEIFGAPNRGAITALAGMDERSRLLKRAERCRRIVDSINDPETRRGLRKLVKEYERRAEAEKSK